MWNNKLSSQISSIDIPSSTLRLEQDAKGFISSHQPSSNPPSLLSDDDYNGNNHYPQIDVSRVSQLDASMLDVELNRILSTQFDKVVQCLPTTIRSFLLRYKPETDVFLSILIWFFTIRKNVPTPGSAMQNLRYRNEAPFSLAPQYKGLTALGNGLDIPTRSQRFTHLMLSIVVPYGWNKINEIAGEERWEFTSEMRWKILEFLDKAWRVAFLTNLIAFLAYGKYRSVSDRLTQMRLVPARNEAVRTLSFEMVNQQLLMEGFSEMLLVLLPLINWSALKRLGSRWVRFIKRWARQFLVTIIGMGGRNFSFLQPQDSSGTTTTNESTNLLVDEWISCSSCGIKPPNMAHRILPCNHIFCYYCIKVPTVSSLSGNTARSCPSCDLEIEQVLRI
jgi:peroxin-2